MSGFGRFSFRAWLILYDVSRYGAGGDRQRAGEVHLSRTTTAGEIAVLGADNHLLRPSGHARPGIDASPTTGLDHMRAGLLENVRYPFLMQ